MPRVPFSATLPSGPTETAASLMPYGLISPKKILIKTKRFNTTTAMT